MACQQPATEPVPLPPRADEWVEVKQGVALLSERAATWVQGLLGTLTKERELRRLEHECVDTLVEKKVISR